ncbi:hypothetical protein BO82DRAFT_165500 [Aspergillus uvarum CBS 121591]|uniref:Nudix hydrolase domain-containing protein n=1 Tax=Aspergillus uvarum CBS 121591 TaxID=1448315 RepID=A0A319CJ15_9EURO|nr:hypothetical protein BO82DRAFT_165500 [Aspergillus uvarum CBS 121591]PYH85676.1 hypothetical protein BO82DRAFT_165500 [Aspergillus uvarum CBS 121591]
MLPAQQQLPIPYIVPPHLEEYNIPLSAFAAARPQFHNIVGGAFIFSTTVPDAVTSITTSASVPTTTKGTAQGTTAHIFPLASTPPPVPVSASSSPSPSLSPSSPSSPSSPTPTAAAQSPQTPTSSATSTPATTPGTIPDDHPHSLAPDDDLRMPEPKTLLLQRSITDSYPCHWENPGGLIDPVRDATVLAGVAREVREETGFHVSRFVDLVCVDEWTKMKRGVLLQETKVTFLVEVREAAAVGWEERVKLAEGEHQAFVWVGEEEVRGMVRDKGKKRKASGRLGVGFINEQGGNLLRGFEVVRGSRGC